MVLAGWIFLIGLSSSAIALRTDGYTELGFEGRRSLVFQAAQFRARPFDGLSPYLSAGTRLMSGGRMSAYSAELDPTSSFLFIESGIDFPILTGLSARTGIQWRADVVSGNDTRSELELRGQIIFGTRWKEQAHFFEPYFDLTYSTRDHSNAIFYSHFRGGTQVYGKLVEAYIEPYFGIDANAHYYNRLTGFRLGAQLLFGANARFQAAYERNFYYQGSPYGDSQDSIRLLAAIGWAP